MSQFLRDFLPTLFRSNRPGYPHPVSSELDNSGIRVAIGDCSVTERRRWGPPYQSGKTVHVHAKHYKHNEDGRTAPGVCGNGSVPLSHSGNVVTRIWNTHTHTHGVILSLNNIVSTPPVTPQPTSTPAQRQRCSVCKYYSYR